MLSSDLKLKLALVGAAGIGLYWMATKAANAAGDVVKNAAGAVDQAVATPVIAVGEMLGIPATNQDQCSIDLANGSLWDASFSCPAGRYLQAVRNRAAGLPLDTNNAA